MKLLHQSNDCDLYRGCCLQPVKATGALKVVCYLDDDTKAALLRGECVIVHVTTEDVRIEVWGEESKSTEKTVKKRI